MSIYEFNPADIPDIEPTAKEELKSINVDQHLASQQEHDQFQKIKQEILSGKRRGHVLARPRYEN